MKAEIETMSECMPHVQKLTSRLDIVFRNYYVLFFPMGVTLYRTMPLYLSFKQERKGYRLQMGASEGNPLI